MSAKPNSLNKPILLLGAAIVLVALVVVIWDQRKVDEPQAQQAQADPFAGLDLDQPKPSFLLLRYVGERGGDEFQRRQAIQWLDDHSRLRLKPRPSEESWLLGMIERGGHPDWDIEETLWIFNNAFNVLHQGKDQAKFSHLLQDLALTHPNMSMRNYAVQHIGVQRDNGKLKGKLADELHASLLQLAQDKEEQVAGAALLTLVNWDDSDSPASPELIELALKVAADAERSTEVRVTALHAAGPKALELARALAPDTQQIIHLRKAAIGCIGEHGSEADTATLEQLAQENFRIAQAANPAIEGIRHRASNPAPRKLIEF